MSENRSVKSTDKIVLSSTQEDDALIAGIANYLVDTAGSVIPPLGLWTSWQRQRDEKLKSLVLERLRQQVADQAVSITNITNLLKNPRGPHEYLY